MVTVTNECCDCATDLYPCRGRGCELLSVKHYFCDECKKEQDVIYYWDDEELCIDCIEKRLEAVE